MKTLFDLDFIVVGLLLWSLSAAAIVTLGAGISRVLSHWAASYRHAIWLATSICIVLTPIASSWVPGMLPRWSKSQSVETRIAADSENDSLSIVSPQSVPNETPLATAPVLAASYSPELNHKTEPTRKAEVQAWVSKQMLYRCLITGLLACWISGTGIYVLRIWRARRQLAQLFGPPNAIADDSLESLVATVARETGLCVGGCRDNKRHSPSFVHVALTITKSEVGPLVWGLWPARLLIPSSLSELPGEAQQAAIRHEFAHVVRGDEWVRRYLVILRAVFWFHPMVRYCCDQVQLYAEKACDDHVLRVGHKPSEYSSLLLLLGKRQSDMASAFVISGMAQSQITSRIQSILQPNTSRKPMTRLGALSVVVVMLIATSSVSALRPSTAANGGTTFQEPSQSQPQGVPRLKVGVKDWPQWGGSSARNNTTTGQKIPLTWDVKAGKNIRWSVPLGTAAYGGVVVANGKVFAGTNNGSAYLKRFPTSMDLGVLLCFNEADGQFLWQHSNPKLLTGRVHDWPGLGVCSAPLVDGDRLWYVNNRGEVVCLDTEGFWDGENDGPFTQEEQAGSKNEADVVWVFDMMKQLGVSQHNMSNCSVTCAGDMLFVNTSNGVDEGHLILTGDYAPSFICLSRETGGVLWTDNSPGKNVLHGQWSSPAYAVLGDVPQVIFGGGDGYLYGFLAQGENGNSKLLWKFDCNPKDSIYAFGIVSTRNHIIATPVIYDGHVYVAVGEDPEHGEGIGHLWCVDPTKRGDVSPTLVFNSNSPDKPIAHKRRQALVASEGDFEKPNPNSAAVWHYVGNNPALFEQTMHRSLSTVAIKNDLLFVPDFSGVFHCVDAKTGKSHWTYDLFAACWASPLIVDDRVYISDEDGDVAVFKLSSKLELLQETNLQSSLYSTPVVANDTLFLSASNCLWAIQEGARK
jgi:outer membrane protein assembly factor BamB